MCASSLITYYLNILQKVNDDTVPSPTPAPVISEPAAAAQNTTPKTKPKPMKKNQDEKALEQLQSLDKSQSEKAAEQKSPEKGQGEKGQGEKAAEQKSDQKTPEQDKLTDKDNKGTESQKTTVLGNTATQEEPKKEANISAKALPESANTLMNNSTDTSFQSKEKLPTAEKSNEVVSGAQPEC